MNRNNHSTKFHGLLELNPMAKIKCTVRIRHVIIVMSCPTL